MDKFPKLLNKVFSNKKVLFLTLGLVLVLSLVPFYFAKANVFTDIWNGIITLPLKSAALFVAIPLLILAIAAGFLYSILISILGWLKVIALSVPVLPGPNGVDVVTAGWNITRNIANMGFILILVFIGLATILRIKDYEAKKLLPILIIAALLINFSPVIVGFVVDISNLITNYFLKVEFQTIGEIWTTVGNYFLGTLRILTEMGTVVNIIGSIIGTVVLGGVITAFFGYACWIYLLVVALLVARIVMLWVLMILAPIAFLFYVLPAGRKLAKEWWQNIVQWSIMAIPIGFFLSLSFKILVASTSSQIKGFFGTTDLSGAVASTTPGWSFISGDFMGTVSDALGKMLVPLVSVVILHIGYKLSKSYMPAAAKGIISGIEKVAKMAAGAALVVATGGAAAGLAVKGLGGIAKGAQGVENFMGRVPLLGKPLKALSKPMSWATRGMKNAATPALLEYQAKTRRLSDKEIEKIDKMKDPAAQEAYINAQTEKIPIKSVRDRQRMQYMAHMADKGTLKYTGFAGPTGEAARLANEALIREDPNFQKEADTILNSTGGITEQALIHQKLVGMPDKTPEDKDARHKKEIEIENENIETENIIQERLGGGNIGRENLIIEVGLKFKYITKEDVARDRNAALAQIQTKMENELRGEAIKRRISLDTMVDIKKAEESGNLAAGATYRKSSKPEDIKDIIDPDNFADRVGITLGNPRNLQKVQDNFGIKKFRAVIEGRGGLNDATDTPEKLEEFAKNVNPAMAQAIFTSPAYREVDLEARNHMRDSDGRPTTSSGAFKDRIEIQKGLESHTELGNYDKDLKYEATLKENIDKVESDLRKLETEARGAENERKRLEREAKDAETESIRLAADARRSTGSKKTDLEAESRKAEIEQGKLENKAKKAEAERIKLETAANTERARINPIVSGPKGPKTILKGLQSQIATEKTTIEADNELNRIWERIEELRK